MHHLVNQWQRCHVCVCRSTARACQLTRGLLPMLATPGPNGDAVLESAILAAAAAGLVAPQHHVVVLQQIHEDFCVKVHTWHTCSYELGWTGACLAAIIDVGSKV